MKGFLESSYSGKFIQLIERRRVLYTALQDSPMMPTIFLGTIITG